MTEKKPLSLKTKRKPLSLSPSRTSSASTSTSPKRTLRLGTKKRIVIKKSPLADISKTFSDAERRLIAAPIKGKTLKKKRRIVNPHIGKHYSRPKTYKPKPPKQPAQIQARKVPPSKIKAQRLDALLTERFEAWRTYQPLQLGIEKQIFQLIGAEHLPFSKRVVQKVLSRHTRKQEYLENTLSMTIRVSLKNEISGEIQDKDKVYAKSKVVVK